MSNREDKPKQNATQLISKIKSNGITFHYVTEEKAIEYLTTRNNYLRTAAYRKNYTKHQKGRYKGQYIHLDFSYLQELSTIDMHFRFLVSKMCLDIEHGLKVRMLQDIEKDSHINGYDIVTDFLKENSNILKKLESTSNSPFTRDLIHKYFEITCIDNRNKIEGYSDCPVWVLLELLTFGDFIKFYAYYYTDNTNSGKDILSPSTLNLIRSLRNAAAHNNCTLADLTPKTSRASREISQKISMISDIGDNQRKKKLSCRPILEFVALLYAYDLVVSNKIKYHRVQELNALFFDRMLKKSGFFKTNDLITSNYAFICKVIRHFFHTFS